MDKGKVKDITSLSSYPRRRVSMFFKKNGCPTNTLGHDEADDLESSPFGVD